MRCPFPGMDPYLERADIWPDFHASLITYIREALQPLLRPKFAALTQERLYVVEHERPIYPDVSLVQHRTEHDEEEKGGTVVTVAAAPDTPLVIEIDREEVRQPVIHIIEPAAGNRIVTAIEVLSPDNKTVGAGRDSYLQKCEELWQARANLVEIDLLRAGESTVRLSAERRAQLPDWHYLVAVTRCWPSRHELYGFHLKDKLPRVSIPLSRDDRDVTLDLQAALARCWESGPYPELLRYDGPPPGEMPEEEIAWCRQRVRRDAS